MELTANKYGITKKQFAFGVVLFCLLALALTITPAFAAPEVPQSLSELVENLVFYIGLIFQVVGVIVGIYSVGQMIMAFKDDNPDAKTRASTFLVVAFILICLPSIIKALDLVNMITGK